MPAPDYPVVAGELHMAMGRAGYVGLVRVEGGVLNVAAALDPAALASATPDAVVNRVLRDTGLPALPADAGAWKGTPPLTREGCDYGGPRLLRLGDAAGYTEPFTGQGISWALADGRAAAGLALRALDGWRPDLLVEWARYRGVRRRRSERLCRGLAWALRRTALVDGGVRLLRVAPSVAAPLVRRAARAPDTLGVAAA
jgi:flavin-dependent dehydrogenase